MPLSPDPLVLSPRTDSRGTEKLYETLYSVSKGARQGMEWESTEFPSVDFTIQSFFHGLNH
jgi:hypothetical protein